MAASRIGNWQQNAWEARASLPHTVFLEVLILNDFKSLFPEVLISGDFKSFAPEVLILVGMKSRGMSELRDLEKILEVLILEELRAQTCAIGGFLRCSCEDVNLKYTPDHSRFMALASRVIIWLFEKAARILCGPGDGNRAAEGFFDCAAARPHRRGREEKSRRFAQNDDIFLCGTPDVASAAVRCEARYLGLAGAVGDTIRGG
jgi:hypothetical protein